MGRDWVIGIGYQVSALLLAYKTASLIEEETLKKRMTKDEGRNSFYFIC
jgi:hypothetical protein